jgi:excisionase family DNA binding protein
MKSSGASRNGRNSQEIAQTHTNLPTRYLPRRLYRYCRGRYESLVELLRPHRCLEWEVWEDVRLRYERKIFKDRDPEAAMEIFGAIFGPNVPEPPPEWLLELVRHEFAGDEFAERLWHERHPVKAAINDSQVDPVQFLATCGPTMTYEQAAQVLSCGLRNIRKLVHEGILDAIGRGTKTRRILAESVRLHLNLPKKN